MMLNNKCGDGRRCDAWDPNCCSRWWWRSCSRRSPRRRNLSAPLALVLAGLVIGLLPGVPDLTLDPEMVLFVLLPPLLWSAGLESSYVNMRRSGRAIRSLAVGLPLATTVAVGFVAYQTVPQLTLAAALTLGAIVAPPDAVSATAIGRRLGLPRRLMTLIGGESLLNDATALTAYKLALGAAIGAAASWQHGLATFALAVVGGVAVGAGLGALIVYFRWRLDDSTVESAIGLLAPFVIYLAAEQIHGSGVLAVVVAALILGQRSTTASHTTRLQDEAVWKAVQLILESVAFLLIGLQLPTVLDQQEGVSVSALLLASAAILVTVVVVRIVWVYLFAFLPRLMSARIGEREPAPTAAGALIVAWAGMRGVVSLAAAFGLPITTLSGAPFPGRAHVIFMTFVVVLGTLLLHGLTLPWLMERLDVRGNEAHTDAVAMAAAQQRAARNAADRLEQVLAEHQAAGQSTDVHERAAEVLRAWNTRRSNSAWEQLGRQDDEIGEGPASAFRRLRLAMLDAERQTFIAERDSGRIDDEVLRTVMRGLDLEEATSIAVSGVLGVSVGRRRPYARR